MLHIVLQPNTQATRRHHATATRDTPAAPPCRPSLTHPSPALTAAGDQIQLKVRHMRPSEFLAVMEAYEQDDRDQPAAGPAAEAGEAGGEGPPKSFGIDRQRLARAKQMVEDNGGKTTWLPEELELLGHEVAHLPCGTSKGRQFCSVLLQLSAMLTTHRLEKEYGNPCSSLIDRSELLVRVDEGSAMEVGVGAGWRPLKLPLKLNSNIASATKSLECIHYICQSELMRS